MLSETDSNHVGLKLIINKLERAGLKVELYGRLKEWDGESLLGKELLQDRRARGPGSAVTTLRMMR
jgi:hypothetical protein